MVLCTEYICMCYVYEVSVFFSFLVFLELFIVAHLYIEIYFINLFFDNNFQLIEIINFIIVFKVINN